MWEKVVRKLRGNMMPPSGEPLPDDEAQQQVVAYLEDRLDAAAAAHPNPGRKSVHRLNRTEYGNAIRDLLALDIDETTLLPNDSEACLAGAMLMGLLPLFSSILLSMSV